MTGAEGMSKGASQEGVAPDEQKRIDLILEDLTKYQRIPGEPTQSEQEFLDRWERFATTFFTSVRTANTVLRNLARPTAKESTLLRHAKREYRLLPYVVKGGFAHQALSHSDGVVAALYVKDDDLEAYLDAPWVIQLQGKGAKESWDALSTVAFRLNFFNNSLDVEQLQGWGTFGEESPVARANREEFQKVQQNPEEMLFSVAEAIARKYGFSKIRLRKPEHVASDQIKRKVREGKPTTYGRVGAALTDPGKDSLYFERDLPR